MRIETPKYIVEYKYIKKLKKYGISIQSRDKGACEAVHTQYHLLDSDNNIVDVPDITPTVAEYIIKHFPQKGDTESFIIYNNDLSGKKEDKNKDICIDTIRHKLTDSEKSFTATGHKLFHHWPIFEKFKETRYQSIIRATMTLH